MTVRGVKSRWRGAEEEEHSFSHSSTSCTSRALTGTSDAEAAPAATPPPRSNADASGSSADTAHTREVVSSRALRDQRRPSLFLLPSLQASKTVELTSICSDTAVEN